MLADTIITIQNKISYYINYAWIKYFSKLCLPRALDANLRIATGKIKITRNRF